MRERFHAEARPFSFAVDRKLYYPNDDATRSPNRIAFYARGETARRSVELGLLGLELAARSSLT